MTAVVPEMPARAPRRHSRLARALARATLRLGGWRVDGQFADVDKLVIIAAPHSSGWDAWWGLLAKIAMGLDIQFMAKHEIFWWPLGPILRALGAVPTDRRAAHGLVGQMIERMNANPRMWLVIAPEGTRKRVTQWKTGFWRIAVATGVPVQCVYFHYPERRIGLGTAITMSGELEADMARVREFYRPWQGKHRGTV